MAIIIKRKAAAPKPDPIVKPVKRQVTLKDGMCRAALEAHPNAAISWFLIASYLYYHHDISIISDALYDELAKAMLAAWDELEHRHKHLITEDHLRAGSLYDLPASAYPLMTRGAAGQLLHQDGISINIMH